MNLTERDDRITLTCKLFAAYVKRNSVPQSEVPNLINKLYQGLTNLRSLALEKPDPERIPNKKQIKASVRQDEIISFLDGKSYRTLKRHLKVHGHTPQSYRDRYGLPENYPMVAPGYTELRSRLAIQLGLGRKES